MRFIKDPETGKRVSRPNPVEQRVVEEVPELRIIRLGQDAGAPGRRGAVDRDMFGCSVKVGCGGRI